MLSSLFSNCIAAVWILFYIVTVGTSNELHCEPTWLVRFSERFEESSQCWSSDTLSVWFWRERALAREKGQQHIFPILLVQLVSTYNGTWAPWGLGFLSVLLTIVVSSISTVLTTWCETDHVHWLPSSLSPVRQNSQHWLHEADFLFIDSHKEQQNPKIYCSPLPHSK
jgi:hypothetical protein